MVARLAVGVCFLDITDDTDELELGVRTMYD